jgi:hypothetical protein
MTTWEHIVVKKDLKTWLEKERTRLEKQAGCAISYDDLLRNKLGIEEDTPLDRMVQLATEYPTLKKGMI